MRLLIGQAFSTVMRTMPYILFRLALHAVVWICALGILATIGLIGLPFGNWASILLFILLVWGGIKLGLFKTIKFYLVDLLNIGHLSIVSTLISDLNAPSGFDQISWVENRLRNIFGDIATLTHFRKNTNDTLAGINSMLDGSEQLPFADIEGIGIAATRLLEWSMPHLGTTVTLHTLKKTQNSETTNIGEEAASCVALYCQVWKELCVRSLRDTLGVYVATFIIAVCLVFPMGIYTSYYIESDLLSSVAFLTIIYTALSVKWILLDPVATTLTFLDYDDEVNLLKPDSHWTEKLETEFDSFNELMSCRTGKQ